MRAERGPRVKGRFRHTLLLVVWVLGLRTDIENSSKEISSQISGNDIFDGITVIDLQPFLPRDLELTGVQA